MRQHARSYLVGSCLVLLGLVAIKGAGQSPDPKAYQEQQRAFSERIEATGLAQPFKGITTDGTVVPGLFAIRSTGVSTAPVRQASEAFLKSLSAAQRARTVFAVDHLEWRKWANQHPYVRDGVSFEEMTPAQFHQMANHESGFFRRAV
jgi:hypothetical protein